MKAKKYSDGKPKLSRIDPVFLEQMAKVLQMGDEKYGDADWMRGMPYSELIDSAKRHLAAMEQGQWLDDESGRFHGAHVATCMMMLGFYVWNGYAEYNDLRYTAPGSMAGPSSQPVPSPLRRAPEIATVVAGLDDGQEKDAGEPHPAPTLDSALDRIERWAGRVIPNRTPEGALQKLVMEELPELLNGDLNDAGEWADVAILVLDGMRLRGIDPVQAIHGKMAINEQRNWETNRFGVVQHVEK